MFLFYSKCTYLILDVANLLYFNVVHFGKMLIPTTIGPLRGSTIADSDVIEVTIFFIAYNNLMLVAIGFACCHCYC